MKRYRLLATFVAAFLVFALMTTVSTYATPRGRIPEVDSVEEPSVIRGLRDEVIRRDVGRRALGFTEADDMDREQIRIRRECKVVFDTAGGTPAEWTDKCPAGEAVKKPVDPSKAGYVFTGWYLDKDRYEFNEPVRKDVKLVAGWETTSDRDERSTAQGCRHKEWFVIIPAAGILTLIGGAWFHRR